LGAVGGATSSFLEPRFVSFFLLGGRGRWACGRRISVHTTGHPRSNGRPRSWQLSQTNQSSPAAADDPRPRVRWPSRQQHSRSLSPSHLPANAGRLRHPARPPRRTRGCGRGRNKRRRRPSPVERPPSSPNRSVFGRRVPHRVGSRRPARRRANRYRVRGASRLDVIPSSFSRLLVCR